MPEQLHDPLVLALPVFVLLIALELATLHFFGANHDWRGSTFEDNAANVKIFAVSVLTTTAFRTAALLGYTAIFAYVAPWQLSSHAWGTWVFALLGIDFLWYVYHRMSHRVRLVWAAHQVHHSSEYFNLTTAARQKWHLWFEVLVWIPLPLLGVPPWIIFTSLSINLVYQFFLHTEIIGKLPRPIEFIFNTPSHHRVHHGSDPEYLDKNYGGILIIWDRLFGTFTAESERPTYGLTKPVTTYKILNLQFREFAAIGADLKKAKTWNHRLGYVFGPPGWEPAEPSNGRNV
ncbi:MAG: sterol desaturase family protein [Mycobacteriaceae bacterium]